jgi:hypothetical protein
MFRTLVLVGVPVEIAPKQIGAPRHLQTFVAHNLGGFSCVTAPDVLVAQSPTLPAAAGESV